MIVHEHWYKGAVRVIVCILLREVEFISLLGDEERLYVFFLLAE